MASTITPRIALNAALEMIQGLPIDGNNIRLRVMDDAAKIIWMAAPWRWSVGVLVLTQISNDTDEVTISGNVPADFLKLVWAGLLSADQPQDLIIVPALPDAGVFKGQPKRITATTVTANTFRLFPIPTGYTSAPYLAAVYKKKHTEITAANESTSEALVMDDEYYYVYQAFVLYYAFLYAEDPRASGQFQVAMTLLEGMKQQEAPVLSFIGEVANG